jgi:hypothetical protein
MTAKQSSENCVSMSDGLEARRDKDNFIFNSWKQRQNGDMQCMQVSIRILMIKNHES